MAMAAVGSMFCGLSSGGLSIPRCGITSSIGKPLLSLPLHLSLQSLSLSHPHSTILTPHITCFSKGYNVEIAVGENEADEAVLRRFRKAVMVEGVLMECKRRLHFESKQEERKRKSMAAARRRKRKRSRFSFRRNENAPSAPIAKAKGGYDDEDDNW